MPSSTDGVYQRNGNLIDYYGRPLDLSRYNLLGPTGPTGPDGQDFIFTSGGTGTIERILSNDGIANDSSVLTPTSYVLDLGLLLPISGQIIRFNTYQSTEDTTGYFLSTAIDFEYLNTLGATSSSNVFYLDSTAPQYGLSPATIKPDRNPNLTPSGFSSIESINNIETEFEISRQGNIASIRAKIYGYNSDQQDLFGLARYPQKTWILNTGAIYSPLYRLTFSVVPDGYGASIGIRNILRYNAY